METIVIFFVGGVTGKEIQEIRDVIAKLQTTGQEVDIIVGSNSWASSDYIYNQYFS